MDGNNEKREPVTFEDLWLMRETSSGWFDGEIKCENVLGDDTPEVGATESITWHVQPSFDHVDIAMCTHIIDEVGIIRGCMSLYNKREIIARYDTMEDFRASEWWEPTINKFAGGDTDATWIDSVIVNGEEFIDDNRNFIGFYPTSSIEMKIGRSYTDSFNNRRLHNGHDTLYIEVGRLTGNVYLDHNGCVAEGTVEEIEQALMMANKLKELGITLENDSIKIPFNTEVRNAG